MLARLQSRALTRGLNRSDGVWIAIGVFAWALRRLRAAQRRTEQVVFRETLKPGQRLEITHLRRS